MPAKLTILKGLPACGKTTKAFELVNSAPDGTTLRVNKDDLRKMLHSGKWSPANETLVLVARDALVAAGLARGLHVLSDDTNLVAKHVESLTAIATRYHAPVEVLDMTNVPAATCIERDSRRPNYVGEKVIRKMARLLNPRPSAPPPTLHDPKRTLAVLCDLDGTIALLNGRDPYNASTCLEDLVNISVLTSLKGWVNTGAYPLFVSGREAKYRDNSERWLETKCDFHFGDYALLMRATGDHRKDSVVKKEIYDQHIAPYYNVACVFDDRDSVVEMWRGLGLTCFQVAPGDF